VSKRHQANRRKTYGRRQHELHERRQRDHLHPVDEAGLDDVESTDMTDRFAFLDPRPSRLRYALGD
jgi:hypothetical protein